MSGDLATNKLAKREAALYRWAAHSSRWVDFDIVISGAQWPPAVAHNDAIVRERDYKRAVHCAVAARQSARP